MSADHVELQGPDLSLGVKLSAIPDGAMLNGYVDDQAVVLVRRGDELFAVGAKCTHYGGPLAEGVIAGETIRCPWHHACFSLRSGEVLRAPARDPAAPLARRGQRRNCLCAGKDRASVPADTQLDSIARNPS